MDLPQRFTGELRWRCNSLPDRKGRCKTPRSDGTRSQNLCQNGSFPEHPATAHNGPGLLRSRPVHPQCPATVACFKRSLIETAPYGRRRKTTSR
jgi:hypothetical protein